MKANRDERTAKCNNDKIIGLCYRAINSGKFKEAELEMLDGLIQEMIVNRAMLGEIGAEDWFLTNLMMQKMMYDERNKNF